MGLLLTAGCGTAALEAGKSYSCTDDGLKRGELLAQHLRWDDLAAPPIFYDDCDDSGSAGIQIALNGGATEAATDLPSGVECVPKRTHLLFGEYERQYSCTFGKTHFALGLNAQTPARARRDGFSVDGFAVVSRE
ncbi:hypothetical protein GCM10011519_34420 [Marmoricola endophyticus]|uniref:Uncharacterized protein n=1 Tax=Marmoricola endophyticus TaxID=2040280 RepID=A0A917BU83_9ACTN|nr:hypothetical protein GCM10011519_34420 [Marmoricola endophyticus]